MSFQDRIREAGSARKLLSSPIPPSSVFPYPDFHTNWRDEQRAWATTAVLFNQSWHMTDLYISGPDAKQLLSDTSTNSYENFGAGRAKQYLAVNHNGYVIGDEILFGLSEDLYALVGEKPAINWIQYQAEAGDYDVTLSRDDGLTYMRVAGETPKRFYRYELEGPNTQKILDKAAGKHLDRVKFFRLANLELGGLTVHALGHTMAAEPGNENTGVELFGPEEEHTQFLDIILSAGAEFGLRQAGSLAYRTTPTEIGWIPTPLPAIFDDEPEMTRYREWLPDDTAENWYGSFGFRGSFYSDNIADYYMTPWDLGYGHMIKFDHDFIGREALEEMSEQPQGRKVWLQWNLEDTARVLADSELDQPNRPRLLPTPATLEYHDVVLDKGKPVGFTRTHGYNGNVPAWISMAAVDASVAEDGREVEILWGDYDEGEGNPYIPNHTVTRIRATVLTSAPVHRSDEAY